MAKNDIEIIPPARTPARVNGGAHDLSHRIAHDNPGGIVSSALTRWGANSQARAYNALANRSRAQADYFDAQSQVVDSYIKRARAFHRWGELPEILAADRARRQLERSEELREAEHQRELSDYRRMTDVSFAQSALVDAQQALRAQREFGYATHELAWKRKSCEMLGVELDAAERRALLREAQQPRAAPAAPTEDELIEQLFAKREELRADGLDTSRIDAALARVGKP